jgi:DNA-binding ferritin-like protein (Dps family)
MNKHEKMSIAIDFIDDSITPVNKKEMQTYVNKAKVIEKAYQELQKDVYNYFHNMMLDDIELNKLEHKLSKVGVSND